MFKKPFKIKSNVQMKGSERRTFKSLLTKSFPKISENEADELLEKKNIIGVVKIVTHDQESLQVYTAQKRPMFFEIRGKIFPTIYFLWKYPELIYAFTTHKQVMSHISNGADLMLPGVLTPPAQSGLPKYGNLNDADVAAVNLSHNKAPIAVGIAAQNSASMSLSNGRGKCVNILHYWGDKLCLLDGNILPVPNMPPPDWLKLNNYDDDFPQLGTVQSKSPTNVDITKELDEDVTIAEETEPNQADSTTETPVPMTVEEMDELLNYCFLGAIKYSKTLELPALTSNFFKIHMLPICPVDKTLDIKKTSYKKLKPFLEKMCEIGLISKMEIKKGVEAIIRINKEHEKFSEFYINPDERPKIKVSESDTSPAASISEQFKITKVVMPIFENQGYQKNDTVGVANIRKCVTNYVKDHNCQHADNPRLCQPDKALEEICKTRSPITWEELMESVLNAMKDCHIVTCGGDTIISNGKISPITLTVAVRSGNKKVTLIDNLDSFGIYIPDFAKELQHGVAASTTISKHPAKKTDQLLVQGNQVSFIYNLLVDKYKVSKQYIKGLENAPKKKKQ